VINLEQNDIKLSSFEGCVFILACEMQHSLRTRVMTNIGFVT